MLCRQQLNTYTCTLPEFSSAWQGLAVGGPSSRRVWESGPKGEEGFWAQSWMGRVAEVTSCQQCTVATASRFCCQHCSVAHLPICPSSCSCVLCVLAKPQNTLHELVLKLQGA